MNTVDEVLGSYTLTGWLLLVNIFLVRTGIAGLFRGKWWWFRPIIQSRVDRSEPAASINEARFRRRRFQLLLAVSLGWTPGLVGQAVLGHADLRVTTAIVAVTGIAAVVYVFGSLRRFDREGRARYVARTIAEGQERIDSLP